MTLENALVYAPSPSCGAGFEPLISANSLAMLAESPRISVVPVSKIAAVLPRTDFPFTEMLLNDACQKPYFTNGASALATNQCLWTIADLVGQRNPGEVAGIKLAICATKEEFRAI